MVGGNINEITKSFLVLESEVDTRLRNTHAGLVCSFRLYYRWVREGTLRNAGNRCIGHRIEVFLCE